MFGWLSTVDPARVPMRRSPVSYPPGPGVVCEPSASPVDQLTPAGGDLLALLGSGLRAAAIAHQLQLPVPIVRARIDELLAALGVRTQLEAVMIRWDHQPPAVGERDLTHRRP